MSQAFLLTLAGVALSSTVGAVYIDAMSMYEALASLVSVSLLTTLSL